MGSEGGSLRGRGYLNPWEREREGGRGHMVNRAALARVVWTHRTRGGKTRFPPGLEELGVGGLQGLAPGISVVLQAERNATQNWHKIHYGKLSDHLFMNGVVLKEKKKINACTKHKTLLTFESD